MGQLIYLNVNSFKTIVYNIDVMRQTDYLVTDPIITIIMYILLIARQSR